MPATSGGWDAVQRRYLSEEVAFNLHARQQPSKIPSLSGWDSTAAYGEDVGAPIAVSPLPEEGVAKQMWLPRMTAIQEAISLANGLQNGMSGKVFSEEWLVGKVSFPEFSEFLSTLVPSRMIVFVGPSLFLAFTESTTPSPHQPRPSLRCPLCSKVADVFVCGLRSWLHLS